MKESVLSHKPLFAQVKGI